MNEIEWVFFWLFFLIGFLCIVGNCVSESKLKREIESTQRTLEYFTNSYRDVARRVHDLECKIVQSGDNDIPNLYFSDYDNAFHRRDGMPGAWSWDGKSVSDSSIDNWKHSQAPASWEHARFPRMTSDIDIGSVRYADPLPRRCRYCGQLAEGEASHCVHCGAEMPAIKTYSNPRGTIIIRGGTTHEDFERAYSGVWGETP